MEGRVRAFNRYKHINHTQQHINYSCVLCIPTYIQFYTRYLLKYCAHAKAILYTH